MHRTRPRPIAPAGNASDKLPKTSIFKNITCTAISIIPPVVNIIPEHARAIPIIIELIF